MPKAADVGPEASQGVVNLLYKELRQERTARAQLQQQLWELEAVTQSSQIVAAGHDAGPTSVQAATATAAATTVLLACPLGPAPSPLQGPSTCDRATAVHNAAAAAAATADPGSSSRRHLLQELQQAANTYHWPHTCTTAWQQQQQQQGSPYLQHQVLQHHGDQTNQQRQQLAPADNPNQQHGRHHQQQQQPAMRQLQQHQQQHLPGLELSAAAAPLEAPYRAPAPTAAACALPRARSGGLVVQQQQDPMYDFPYPPPRVATPHLRPTAPAVAITPLTNQGCSSSGPCWSAPASCVSSSSGRGSTAHRSRSGGPTVAAAAAAALLSPEAASVLSSAAAARDRNSLQLLMDALGSSSSDSEVDDSSTRPSGSCNMESQQLPKYSATATATALAHDTHTQLNLNHCQYHHDQRRPAQPRPEQQQQQWHGKSSTFSIYSNAPSAATSSSYPALLLTADVATGSVAAATATALTASTRSTAVDVQSPSWDQEIETFCSMLDGLDHWEGTAPMAPAQAGSLQQLHPIDNQRTHTPERDLWQEDAHLLMPQPRLLHHQQRLQQSSLAAAYESQSTEYAGDSDLATFAEAIQPSSDLPERRSGVEDRTSSGCRDCTALQEQLQECEFERELAVAQLAVVMEERDVLAQQHESLIEMVLCHQAHR